MSKRLFNKVSIRTETGLLRQEFYPLANSKCNIKNSIISIASTDSTEYLRCLNFMANTRYGIAMVLESVRKIIPPG